MSWVDAHCHLSAPSLDGRVSEIIGAGAKQGIGRWLLGGYDAADWSRQRELQKHYPNTILMAFGIHPWSVHRSTAEQTEEALVALQSYIRSGCQIYAIGEIGLDRSLRSYKKNWQLQLDVFDRQLALAVEAGLPIVLHVVQAHGIALNLLGAHAKQKRFYGLVHSFVGSADIAAQYAQLGIIPSLSQRSISKLSAADLKRITSAAFLIESDFPQHLESSSGSDSDASNLLPHQLLLDAASQLATLVGGSCNQWMERSAAAFDKIFGGRP